MESTDARDLAEKGGRIFRVGALKTIFAAHEGGRGIHVAVGFLQRKTRPGGKAREPCPRAGLGAQTHDKVLKIARTIADLEESAAVQAHHVSEVIQYRRLDRKL
jgi:hypothetical protein